MPTEPAVCEQTDSASQRTLFVSIYLRVNRATLRRLEQTTSTMGQRHPDRRIARLGLGRRNLPSVRRATAFGLRRNCRAGITPGTKLHGASGWRTQDRCCVISVERAGTSESRVPTLGALRRLNGTLVRHGAHFGSLFLKHEQILP